MNASPCDPLDAYLAGWLSGGQAARFEIHLAGCPACRQARRQQERIDALLARAAGRIEPAPSRLVEQIEVHLRQRDRSRQLRYTAALATSAAVLLGLGVWLAGRHLEEPTAPGPVANIPLKPASDPVPHVPFPTPASNDEPHVRVASVNPSKTILVPVQTETPNVTIVWVYPTLKPPQKGS